MRFTLNNNRFLSLPLLAVPLLAISNTVSAQPTARSGADPAPMTFKADSPQACITLRERAERLKCFDAFFQPADVSTGAATQTIAIQTPASPITPQAVNQQSLNPQVSAQQSSIGQSPVEKSSNQVEPNLIDKQEQPIATASWRDRLNPLGWVQPGAAYNPENSLLDRRWELSRNAKLGTFQLKGYKPNYILPVFITDNINDLPTSPNPDNQVTAAQDISKIEGKFQLSFKTKAWEGLFGDYGDVWLGYSQSSHWQVYNPEDSRPFRETNYEPEASLIFATNYNVLGLNGRLLGVSLNHQSNGRSLPLSRSWNRVIGNIGFERDNFALMLRPWYRIPDADFSKDDNPDIKDYLGRGDLQAFYKYRQQEFALMLRHSLKGGERSRGAVQFDWTFPISGNLRGYMQVFDGYGESLIDYNHKAAYVGFGISLLNWY